MGMIVLNNAEKIYAERTAMFSYMNFGNEGSIIPLTQLREARAE
jgi:hypothetical protein